MDGKVGEMKWGVRQNSIVETKAKNGDKPWVYLTLTRGRQLVIAFEHLYYLIKEICECEERKYPGRYHKGKIMVGDFLADIVWSDETYESLADKYQLPKHWSGPAIKLETEKELTNAKRS